MILSKNTNDGINNNSVNDTDKQMAVEAKVFASENVENAKYSGHTLDISG